MLLRASVLVGKRIKGLVRRSWVVLWNDSIIKNSGLDSLHSISKNKP